MGTSQSYKGPGDQQALLPSWALPTSPPDAQSPEPVGTEIDPSADDGGIDPDVGPPPEPNRPLSPPLPSPPRWKGARSALGKITKGATRARLRRAARDYVSAKGGSRGAAASASAGRAATANIGNFLSQVVSRGLDATMRAHGLESFIGKDAEVVLSAIADLLAPAGTTQEETVARMAVSEVFSEVFEKLALDQSLSNLEQLTSDGIRELVIRSVTLFIYHRWLQELGRKLEEKSVSARQAVKLERDVKAFVEGSVELDLADRDVLTMDWQGIEGQRFVNGIYADAYRLIAGGES